LGRCPWWAARGAGPGARPIARGMSPPRAPTPAGPDFSSLERQLLKITSQIDALQRPDDGIEQSIAAFRAELAEIRQTITEAMPRRAIESIENEIRSLSRRIDDSRHSGIDPSALTGVERALAEIQDALRALTPAEQLAGFDDAIRNLGAKIDLIVRSSDDPGTLQQLEGAIAALRAIVSNVASNEALAQLSDNVHTLSSKVDQLAQAGSASDSSFAALEQRISALTAALESRDRPAPSDSSDQLEVALRALSDRLDHLQVGQDSASAFAHLEQRVSYLLERMEQVTGPGTGNLGRVEEGLQDILRHLERQQTSFAALTARDVAPVAQMDPALVETIKRELSDMRFSQSETDRHTQDSLEAVHNTLGHVVDRLAMIEGDLRTARSAAPSEPVKSQPAQFESAGPKPAEPARAQPAAAAPALPPRPDLPNPAGFDAAPRQFGPAPAAPKPQPAQAVPRAIHDILDPRSREATPVSAPAFDPPKSRAVDPDLPPDYPLEPGTRPIARVASPSERIAASENAISEIQPAAAEPASTSSFIAAARRAAQAAAAAATPAAEKPKRAPKNPDTAPANPNSSFGSKIRALLVGASVVVIVLGSFKMTMNLLDSGSAPVVSSAGPSAAPAQTEAEPEAEPEAEQDTTAPAPEAPRMPSMTSPTPIGRQSLYAPAPAAAPQREQTAETSEVPGDITGTIPAPQPAAPPSAPQPLGRVTIPANEKLPTSIGGPVLRNAALKGDASAAYEVGMRYAEGKGVAANFDEAAKWYTRAAKAGVVPAVFRLGTLYEKGLSVKRDLAMARVYYAQAAERGNAKAMHNLAVLDADGGGKGANYKSAVHWFRKAAARGVADSQFNLGILYARGIGVEQNLAESYKWFSLAAAQGDVDAGNKRDDVAKRLDPQSLSAAKLAVQTFTLEPQPSDATEVASPPGGWDAATSAAAHGPAKRAAR
ncbi:hypothetical protein P3G22_10890, partial [Rhodopseudomonas sp. BAL398]